MHMLQNSSEQRSMHSLYAALLRLMQQQAYILATSEQQQHLINTASQHSPHSSPNTLQVPASLSSPPLTTALLAGMPMLCRASSAQASNPGHNAAL
jgi:hypothetical protein